MNSYWQKIRSDPTRPLVLFTSICLAIKYCVQFYWEPHLLFLVLAFRFWIMSVFIAKRFAPSKQDSWFHRGISYISKFVPSFYRAPSPTAAPLLHGWSDTLIMAGALLSTWAMMTLGRRFGISPAKRGDVCYSGAYRWMRHPIYWGYAMVELGGVLLNHKNLPIFAFSMGLLAVRATWENKILSTI